MKRIHKILSMVVLVAFIALTPGCDKMKPYDLVTPPAQVHFVGDKNQTYTLEDASSGKFKVTVGTTDVAAIDRIITYKVMSKTGAIEGKEYTLSPAGSVTIPAGKTTADIEITGNYTYYESGRKDTLSFSLIEPSIKVAGFMNEAVVILRGPCFDGDVTLSEMGGDYANSTDADEPLYTVKLSGLEETSPTTGKGMISNLWNGAAPVKITFDWTDPTNIKTAIAWQPMGFDYAAGNAFSIRTTPGKKSTFSICDQTITLRIDIIVEDYYGPDDPALFDTDFLIRVIR